MLYVYQSSAHEDLRRVDTIARNVIVYLAQPEADDIVRVAEGLRLPPHAFTDVLAHDKLPGVTHFDGATVLALSVPRASPEGWTTVPLGIVLTRDHVVLIANEPLMLVSAFLQGAHGEFRSHMQTRVCLLLFRAIANAFGQGLKDINAQVAERQQRLRTAYRNTELFALIGLSKSLVRFSGALSTMAILYERLMAEQDIRIHEDERHRLLDILIDIRQSAEITEMRRESLSNLMDAYAAIIHNNLNAVLKVLTALTIVLSVPTMIGSIFSMNVALPFEESWVSTIVVSVVTLFVCLVLATVFQRRKFFNA